MRLYHGTASLSDEKVQRRHVRRFGCLESVAEVVPEGNSELFASLHEAEECVSGRLSGLRPCATGDFPSGDAGSDVIFRSVGVKRQLWAVEDQKQIGLIGI